MTDIRYWLWLSLGTPTGSAAADKLMQSFKYNPKAVFDADPMLIKELVGKDVAVKLNALRNFSKVDRLYDYCQKENIGLLTPDSKFYPSSLLRITGQPPVIYYKGRIPDFTASPVIGVVGTRKVTAYGKSAAYTLSHDLASAGAIVVSGMALGTDTAAHRGALDAKGATVAFLGCGIDVVYPRENQPLMKELEAYGAVMTDYAPGERPEGWHFPLRNRLISGVSHGVLVVEAAMKSGALITADHAKKQGKLIYAVPGKVGELTSTGTNNLIRGGAKMVTSSSDILSDFKGLFGDISEQGRAPAFKKAEAFSRPATPFVPAKKFTDENISYPEAKMPPEGFKITTDEPRNEAFEEFDEIPSVSEALSSNTEQTDTQSAEDILYDHIKALRSLRSSQVIKLDNAKNEKAPSTKAATKAAPKTELLDISELSDGDRKIVEFVRAKGKASVDGMTSLGIPIPLLLATLTGLEVRGFLEQLPGGYFISK